ncbi:MAG: phosphoribosyl-ATP diphosphatase [Alphaproteobacteria bacterium]|nr:phosphoribosyl-ATP diphosphatase [Alphaproteobacteria bacterium]MBV9693665.1 phosphoribosyl-ATP diphosphatase [Alphaproteobacteria bacterium]
MAELHPIDKLYETIAQRGGTSPKTSYTAQLLKRGIHQCAKKLGEEGVEAALAAVGGRKKEIIEESADVLYHLLVVWAATGVKPKAVYDALDRRRGRSGLARKKARLKKR